MTMLGLEACKVEVNKRGPQSEPALEGWGMSTTGRSMFAPGSTRARRTDTAGKATGSDQLERCT
jgi:hypothetical protein